LSLFGIGSSMRLPGSHEVATFSNASGLIIGAVASTLSDVLVLAGIVLFFRSRLLAYQLWRNAILLFVLVGGMVAFYYVQYQFVAAFVVNAAAIVVLTGLIREEQRSVLRVASDRLSPGQHPAGEL
jgi:hypothetical protein